jgi:type I restriction enzyme S subunit
MRKYDSYKDSDIEWIGEIPSHWEVLNLRKRPFNFEVGKREQTDLKEVVSIGGEHIQEERFFLENLKYVSLEFFETAKNGKIREADILLVKDGATIGKAMFVDRLPFEKMMLNEHVYKIEANKFFYYIIQSPETQYQFWMNNQSSAQESITSNTLKSFVFCWPNEQEQTAIAAYLDRKTAEIDELIADKKRLLELYEEEKTAIINQAVTKGINPDAPMKDSGIEWLGEIPEHWEVSLLKRFCKVTDGSHYSPKTQEFGLPYVSVKDVGENSIDLINCKKISVEDFDALTKNGCKPKEGDVLLTKDGTIGRAAIVTSDHEPFVILSSLGLITPNEKLIAKYLYYYLISGLNIDQMYSFIHGSALTRLTIEKINNLNITIPPIDEQGEIVNQIESKCSVVNSKKAKTEKLIELLTEYRTALISEVVTGKIKVIE